MVNQFQLLKCRFWGDEEHISYDLDESPWIPLVKDGADEERTILIGPYKISFRVSTNGKAFSLASQESIVNINTDGEDAGTAFIFLPSVEMLNTLTGEKAFGEARGCFDIRW